MRTISVNIYKVDELTEDNKANAIEQLRSMNIDHSKWYEYTYNKFIERMKTLGMTIEADTIFHSDLDGQNLPIFTCETFDYELMAQKVDESHNTSFTKYVKTLVKEDQFKMEMNPTYRRMSVYIESNCGERTYGVVEEYTTAVSKFITTELTTLRDELKAEYEHQTSDETILESIEANEYEFYDSGEMYLG